MSIKTDVVEITPALAEKWLESSRGNRTISHSTVTKYTNDILNGKWVLNGEAIIFDGQDTLRDGHHRLSAIIKADKPIKSLVVWGVEPNECGILDMGRARTCRDTMIINGVDTWKANPAIITCVRTYYRIFKGIFSPSYNEIISFIEQNETELFMIYEHLHIGGGTSKIYICKKGAIVLAVLSAMKCGVFESELWGFMESLNSGIISSPSKSAVIKLRNMIIFGKVDSTGAKVPLLLFATENSIRDYASNTPRIKEYTNCKPIYSEKAWGKSLCSKEGR